MKTDAPVPLRVLIDDLLDRAGLRAQVARVGVIDRWQDIVGGAIAEATKAKAVSGGTLFVEVASSSWLMELNGMKLELLDRVNESTPEFPITRIVFVLREGGRSYGPRPRTRD